jgi:hypothetical protein
MLATQVMTKVSLDLRNLCNAQCGFRRPRTTIDHPPNLDNYIQNVFALRQHLVAVLYLHKVYDVTWRYGILRALHRWNLRTRLPTFSFGLRPGSPFSRSPWMFFFSARLPQENGMTQGYILSVTLFAIAIMTSLMR